MIKLPPPPRSGSETEWEQYTETTYRYIKGSVATSGDAAETLSGGTTYHGVTALSAPRTLTLPAASDLSDGDELVVQDESGAAGTHTITIARAGSDTINGATSATITSNYGRKRLIKRGAGQWFSS